MIDAYKRVLVGQYEQPEESAFGTDGGYNLLHDKQLRDAAQKAGGVNPELLEYGTKEDRVFQTGRLLVEITGTNTMAEKAFLESVKAGEVKEITFTQKMSLQGGEYLLSLGVTGYEGDRFEVYHRLYDVLNITVISDKNTVGYYDMDSEICVK